MKLVLRYYLIAACVFVRLENSEASVAGAPCESVASAKEYLRCVLAESPLVRIGESEIKQAHALKREAGQMPNPELAADGRFQNQFGEHIYSTESALTYTFELGGKRSARMSKAQAGVDRTAAEVKSARLLTIADLVATLVRLRHLNEEQGVLSEALSVFQKIRKQYASRRSLTPDQESSLALFDLATRDYEMRYAAGSSEMREAEAKILLAAGQSVKDVSTLLPVKRKTWPKLSDLPTAAPNAAPELASIDAQVREAAAARDVAGAIAWPDLKIGPLLVAEFQGNDRRYTYGGQIALPLPLLNRNQGGRDYARHKQEATRLEAERATREFASRRELLLKRYGSAISSLESNKDVVIHKKHEKIDRLFNIGVLSATALIEVHRQILDFTTRLNEQELGATRSLWQIYAMDGVLEGKIETEDL